MKPVYMIAGVVLSLNVLLGGGLWYALGVVDNLRAEEARLRQEIARANADRDSAATLAEMLRTTANDRAKLDAYFYEHNVEEGLRFVKEIEALARRAGVTMTTSMADFSDSEPEAPFRMDLQISGTWPQYYHFIRMLETFPARVTIGQVNAQQGSVSAGSGEGGALWSGGVSMQLTSVKGTTK